MLYQYFKIIIAKILCDTHSINSGHLINLYYFYAMIKALTYDVLHNVCALVNAKTLARLKWPCTITSESFAWGGEGGGEGGGIPCPPPLHLLPDKHSITIADTSIWCW